MKHDVVGIRTLLTPNVQEIGMQANVTKMKEKDPNGEGAVRPPIASMSLKDLRREIGWSTVQVATLVHRSEGWVRRVERGVGFAPPEFREWLEDAAIALRNIEPPDLG